MSKKLDDELAAAIGTSGDTADKATAGDGRTSTPPTAAPVAARREPQKKNTALLVVLLAMVAAVVALFFVGIKQAAIYASPVDELAATPAAMIGRKVRIEGELSPGSLVKRDQPCEYRFKIRGSKKEIELPIRYAQCVIPDTFRDVPEGGVTVTVEGALAKSGDFEATLVMAKCTSKYDPKTHEIKDKKPGAAPLEGEAALVR